RTEVLLPDAVIEAEGLFALDERGIGARGVDSHGSCGEEDARRRAGAADESSNDFGRKAVMHDGPAFGVDRYAVSGYGAVAGWDEDHLEPREVPHEPTVRFAEPRHVLGGHTRPVHAGLEHESFVGGTIDVVALGVADVVGDVVFVFGDQDVRGVAGEALADSR